MELRQYLEILRRRLPFIAEVVVIVALAAGIGSSLRTDQYTATARVWLKPDNPSEQLNPEQRSFVDPNRYVQAQIDIAGSDAVAAKAAEGLEGLTGEQVAKATTVSGSSDSDVIEISATDEEPAVARNIANAVAAGYVENRRQSAVAGLEQAAKDLDDKLAALQASIADLDAQLAAGGTARAPQVDPSRPPVAANGNGLEAARYAAAVQYQTLYARQQELAVDIQLQRGSAEVIAEAKTPTKPVSPRPLRDGILGGAIGLLLAVGIVVLREQLDDRVRSAESLERDLGFPLLAQLPYDDESAGAGDVAMLARPSGALSEAVRSLRTSIQYVGIDQSVKTIVVTSAEPSEGKSVVSANLAAAYAVAGFRTVLIGADLRRPGVSALLGIPRSAPGFTDAIASLPPSQNGAGSGGQPPGPSSAEINRLLTRPARNLAFLPPGTTPPNPAEILGSQRTRRLLEELGQGADVIIIDTPPLLPVTDAAILAAKADGVVLVLAVNESRKESAKRAKAIVENAHARVLGVVLNKASRAQVPYYYAGYEDTPAAGAARPRPRKAAGRAPEARRKRATQTRV